MTEFIGKHYITPHEVSIKTTWIREDSQSKTVCIMFPGKGYTTQRPLFHYLTSLVRSKDMDVLQLEYDYTVNEKFQSSSYEEQDRWMYEDCYSVIEQFLEAQSYEQTIWVSKSIGTIPMAIGWRGGYDKWSPLCGIWLTPLLSEKTVEEALRSTRFPSLLIIGNQDSEYNHGKLEELNRLQVQTKVISGANHGLELEGDVLASLEKMKEIVQTAERFLSTVKEETP